VIVDNLFEISGGVIPSGMDAAPPDFRMYFRTLQYFYLILSALKQGHFEHKFFVERLMYIVYLTENLVVI